MVVCKYFLQGSCRFGSNCRFEHSYNSKYSYHAQNNPPQQAQVQGQGQGVTDEQLVHQVRTDIQAVIKGKQWILSCYTPFKEKPTLPGLTDLCPEEARLFIYEAKANNTLDQAVTYMNALTAETQQKYEQLLQPTPAVVNCLRSLYKGEVCASPFIAQNQAFGAASVFRSALHSTNTQTGFGQQQNTAAAIFNQKANSVFGGSSDSAKSVFAQASQSIFGPSQQNQSPFGAQGQNPPFGQSPQNQNAFGAQNQSLPPFGSTAATSFGVAPSAAQSQFGAQHQNTSPFGSQAPSQSPFGTQNDPAKSIFAQANQTAFSAPQQQNLGVFSSSPFSQPPDPFGQRQSAFGAQAPETVDAYSKIEDISETDLEAFKSSDFRLGFIPEIPPPQSLCI